MSKSLSEPFYIGTFSAGKEAFPGIVLDGQVVDLRPFDAQSERLGVADGALQSTRALLATWQQSRNALRKVAALIRNGEWVPELRHELGELALKAPFEPGQIYCTGANYAKQLIQLIVQKGDDPQLKGLKGRERELLARKMVEKRALVGEPYLFTRPASTVTGPHDPILLPRQSTQSGWGLGLGVVIGLPARNVSSEHALDYVAGYTVVNDITQHDRLLRADFPGADWLSSKGAPGSFPLGPYLVPAEFVADAQQLDMTLKVNDEIMQHESTADMVLDVARQVEYLSGRVQLLPGDVIATGTPTGGAPQHRRYLREGDMVESTIAGLGTQRNRCVVES